MKNHLLAVLLAILFPMSGYAQCPGSLTCEGAVAFCTIDQLNGFVCGNPNFPSADFPLPTLCFGVGVPHNLSWWAFIGNGYPLNLTFNFNIDNCEIPFGIQAGVFQGSCDGTDTWDCNASCNTSTFSLSGPTLKGQSYFVWVDGCNGDVCQYTISTSHTQPGGGLMLPDLDPIRTDAIICPGGTVEFYLPVDSLSPSYKWFVNDSLVKFGDRVEVILPEDAQAGDDVIICVDVIIGNPYNYPDSMACDHKRRCDTFKIPPIAQHIGGCKSVCFEDQPFLWHGIKISSSCIVPPCSVRVMKDDCLVDSFKSFVFLPSSGIGTKDTFLCEGEPFQTEDGRIYMDEICDRMIEFGRLVTHPACTSSTPTCDTSYRLTLGRPTYSTDWEFDCASCSGMITLTPNVESSTLCPTYFGRISYNLIWYDENGDSLGMTEGHGSLDVEGPGTYCVEIEALLDGGSQKCPFFVPECITIPADFFPEPEEISGQKTVCKDTLIRYEVTEHPSHCEYQWSVSGNGSIQDSLLAKDSAHVQVAWDTSSTDSAWICVEILYDCARVKSCQTIGICPVSTSSVDLFGSSYFYDSSTRQFSWDVNSKSLNSRMLLFGVDGRIVDQKKIDNQTGRHQVSNVASGIYFLVVVKNGQHLYSEIIYSF